MPVRWDDTLEGPRAETSGASSPEAPIARLLAQPHQSMTPGGFVTFMGATAIMLAMPLFAVLGTPVLWGLLPFLAISVAGLWIAVNRNQRDAGLTETLTLWYDRMELVREEPGGLVQRWEANPHWVSVHLHPGTRPVKDYLTLKGGAREVELGAFLSPEERRDLHDRLTRILGRVRAPFSTPH